MIYSIVYTTFKDNKNAQGARRVIFENKQALIFENSEEANKKYEQLIEKFSDLLDGSPTRKRTLFGRSEVIRKSYPQERIAVWRQMLQTLEIVPYDIVLGLEGIKK
ncbi:MAG: hypothetical protein [Caudoviricetes sp.]|nr:MAG: hypothetical protein [Caudoviricetes sp.]